MAKRAPKPTADRTTDYARRVAAGEIVAGRLVRLACRRHLQDLEAGPGRGLRFDREQARFAFDFFEQILRLNGGEHEGKPFALQPFQAFIVGSLFGWLGPDGARRFRTAFIEMAKGQGKSPLAAGIGFFCLIADGEPRAEVYAAATKRDQAAILFRDAVAMVDQSPDLAAIITKTGSPGKEWHLAHLESGSFFRIIASDDKSQSGPRPHCALIDEVHEHRTPAVIDMMLAGRKGRRQALVVEITNSGSDRTSICWRHHQYSASVLEGTAHDDAWFAFVCHLDPCERHQAEGQWQPVDNCPECDSWLDESKWLKTNPNLGVSVTLRYLRDQVTMARGMPAAEGEVLRLNFCRWTQVASRAIPADRWLACASSIDEASFAGRECGAGLDIGATSDFCAFVRLFPHDDEEQVEVKGEDEEAPRKVLVRRSYTALPTFWLPADPVKRDPHTADLIELWRRQGFIRTTPGNLVDYAQVVADIREMGLSTPFFALAIDRAFQGNWIAGQLLDSFGPEVVKIFPQGIVSMNPPFRELLELVKAGRFHHPGNPVFDWMAGNTAAEHKSGLIKPSKDHSPEKIDGVTAATMALGVSMTACVDNQASFYGG